MKTFRLLYASTARDDISRIFNSVFEATASVKIASAFVTRIEQRCVRICDAPSGGRLRSDIIEGLRTVPFEHSAMIVYTIGNDTVEIFGIFYHGQDYETLLRPP